MAGLNSKEKTELVKRIKSSIARQIWRNEGFFEVSNASDETIKTALSTFQK
jgi:carboxyl-terminal processing protease